MEKEFEVLNLERIKDRKGFPLNTECYIVTQKELEVLEQALIKAQKNARSEEILQKHYQEGITLDSVRALKQERDNYKKVLEIIKNKSKNNYNLALVVDSETHEVYCKQFEYFLNDYKEKGGAFEIWEEDKFSLEEYNLLREVFVYGKSI